MHPVVFRERYYDAYNEQKNYLKNEISKPFGVSMDKAFRQLDLLCKTLEYFPPPSDRDSIVTAEEWAAFEAGMKEVPTKHVRQYKFNLLPEH